MANINITDSRKRDAVVKAESISPRNRVRYIGPKGGNAYTRKILKATVDHDYDSLLERAEGDKEKLAQRFLCHGRVRKFKKVRLFVNTFLPPNYRLFISTV